MYQQKVKEKEEKIADLTNKVQAQEARINQLREQAESQPTDSLDEAVKKVVRLRGELADAEDEKQKAYSHMLEAKQWIYIASEQVIMCLI